MKGPIVIGACIIYNKVLDKILLGKRMNIEEKGLYGFPGGKQEVAETIEQCVRRETTEETGLFLNKIVFLGYVDEFIHNHYFAMLFLCDSFEGILRNVEPEKCEEWEWIPRREIPYLVNKTKLLELVVGKGLVSAFYL